MSKGYNKVILLGGLTKDPDVKQTQGGTPYLRFNLACGYSVKDQDGQWTEKTDYVPCTAWGNVAEAIEKYCVKGSQLMVEGKVFTNKYKDRDGKDVWDTSVRVSSVCFAGGRRKDEGGNGGDRRPVERGEFPDDFSQYEEPRSRGSRGGRYDGFAFRDGPDMETADIPF